MPRITIKTMALLLLAAVTAGPAAAAEYKRIPTDKPVLDHNGDGFQDVVLDDRKVHYDIDFDGRFDYTLVLSFAEYTSAGHEKYLASNCSSDVFTAITMEGLDELCAQDREEQRWFENNFETFTYYHDGYGFLYIFSDSPENDGRIADPKGKGTYDYYVTFNPDGTVKSVRQGEKRVEVSSFDYESKSSSGEAVRLPKIEKPEDLEKILGELNRLLEAKKGA